MGCTGSSSVEKISDFKRKEITMTVEPSLNSDNAFSLFDQKLFKTVFLRNVSAAAAVAIQNVYIVSLKRSEVEGAVDVTYTISKENTANSLLILTSTMATYIASGGMTRSLNGDGFHNLSANTFKTTVSFSDKSPRASVTVLQISQRIVDVIGNKQSNPSIMSDKFDRMSEYSQDKETTEELQYLRTEEKLRAALERKKKANKRTILSFAEGLANERPYKSVLRRESMNPDFIITDAFENVRDSEYLINNDPLKFAEKCTTAIENNLRNISGVDLQSICVMTINPDGPDGILVDYTVNVTLNNVQALMVIIADAVEKGHFRSVLDNKGGHIPLSRALVVQSTTSLLLAVSQKFTGVSMPPGCPILDFTIPNFFPTFPRSEKNPYMSPSETAAASKLSKKSLSGLSEVSEMEDGSSIVSCLELSNIDESLNDTVVTDINTKDISTSEINRENKKNPIPSLQLKKSTQMPSSVLSDTSSVHRSNHVGAGDSPLTSILKGSPNHNFSGTASPRTIGMKSEGGSIEKGDRNSSSYKSNVDPDCSEFRMKYVQITGDRSPTSCQSIDTDKSRCEKAINLLNDEVKKNKKYHDEENWGGNFVSGKRGFNVSDNECKHTEMKERMTDTS